MPFYDDVFLLLAGIGAGLTGSIAGLASLVSYPVLLALGLAPVTANVSNTIALVFSSAGSISGSRTELTGQAPLVRRLLPAAVGGGVIGGALLLLAPAASFEKVVPWLIALASVIILLPRRPPRPITHSRKPLWLFAATALIGVYGGYFGAAAGVLMLAALLAMTQESMARSNAAKNVLLGAANAIAAIAFVFFGPVRWLAVIPLAIGLFIGGRIGPSIVRRSQPGPLRFVIAIAGLGLAIDLGWQAY